MHSLAILCVLLSSVAAQRPNVVVIVADDLGYSDLACYGGEIATPNLDALARDGLRFTQFYNTARCWPSRAAILTGYYAQAVRRDAVPEVRSGTSGVRPPWARLLPQMLRPLGYRSYHAGKWHVDGSPLEGGFDHSYSLDDHDRHFAPKRHREDGTALPAIAEGSGYYSSAAIADHAIAHLRAHQDQHAAQPFFAFVAFTAPHFPLHAPPADVARYQDKYQRGWDAMRVERWERMQALGIGGSALAPIERDVGPPYAFPTALAALGPREVNRPVPWDGLDAEQRVFQAAKMAVHAAMVDRMDREIGRVLAQLDAMGATANTLVFFLSDNGASAEMMVRGDGHDPHAACGTGATFLSLGPGWSSLANTPFRRHKSWVHEGGIATPMLVRWPHGIAARGELRRTPGHVVDLVPTILEVAGAESAATLSGMSLVPQFATEVARAERSLWWLHEGNRALRVGDWKIVATKDGAWELYDLGTDRSETNDLAAAMPEKVRAMAAAWTHQTEACFALARQDTIPPYRAWQHHGTCWLLTDQDGAAMPATAAVEDFPVLVRLQRASFAFAQAQPRGEDLRFTDAAGAPLAYEIEAWDAAQGVASVWVRVPRIVGDARQALHLHWGNPLAQSESNGGAVFGAFNGFVSVLHLGATLQDAVGTVTLQDAGTTPTVGMVGAARHFDGHSGIFGGDDITAFPSGAGASSTEAWFAAERPNTTVLAWGKEQRPGKVMLNLLSPPRLAIQCYFADVEGKTRVALREWTHVVHTYQRGDSRVYVNGVLDGASTPILDIPKVVRLDIGGWHGGGFVGHVDEARISQVARTPEWIALSHANQKRLQTLVGPLVGPLITVGDTFAASVDALIVPEGGTATVTAQAGGAQKLYWRLLHDGGETTVAVDQLEYSFIAGRVASDRDMALRLVAVYPQTTRTIDIPVTVREGVPDPEFELAAPPTWDGRQTLVLAPRVSNLDALRATTADKLNYAWRVDGIAVVEHTEPGRLVLERAQASGVMKVTLAVDNGGTPTEHSVTIEVQEPAHDVWAPPPIAPNERPEDHQFFARDDQGTGCLVCRGTLPAAADRVFLRVFADGQPYADRDAAVLADRRYDLSVRLQAGLVRYRVEFGTRSGSEEVIAFTADDLVCGDAFLVNGQSNAEATDVGAVDPPLHSEWVRSFGYASGDPGHARTRVFGNAVCRSREGGKLQVGYWALLLAQQLVEAQRVPICILNGAVGGSRIDQHQRNANDPEDVATIYGRLLWRTRQAKLTHGIRGVIWHQGENDQGADGPTGRFGWETYRDSFFAMAAGWRRDFPNVQQYYAFQIWPKACAMGIDGSDDMLREVQRTLPRFFARLHTLSTLGIEPPGGCHYPLAGYAEFARLLRPLLERDFYGKVPTASITAPNLRRASLGNTPRDRIVLEFDQPVVWQKALASQFYLDGASGQIVDGTTAGNTLTLRLTAATAARTITYLDSRHWQPGNVLRGENGIAALSFCRVPIEQ